METVVNVLLLILLLALATAGAAIVRNSVSMTDPPGPVTRLMTYLGKNTARTGVDHDFPELRTRAYHLSPDELAAAALHSMEDIGWTEIAVGDSGTFHAVAVTPWLRFRDDITVELEAESPRHTRVHVCSSSRVGKADFGANIRHIADYYDALRARVRELDARHAG